VPIVTHGSSIAKLITNAGVCCLPPTHAAFTASGRQFISSFCIITYRLTVLLYIFNSRIFWVLLLLESEEEQETRGGEKEDYVDEGDDDDDEDNFAT